MNRISEQQHSENNQFGRGDFHAYKMTEMQALAVERAYLEAMRPNRARAIEAKALMVSKDVLSSFEVLAKLMIVLAIVLLCLRATAKTNPEATLEQLKTNAENSEFNFKQYKDNLDVVNKNVDQSEKAIKELRTLKQQLKSNTQNVDKNKKSLADMQLEIQKLKKKEQEKMAQDEKQLAEVRKILEKLEANKKKREENLTSYDQMNMQVQEEIKDWDTQVQQMATLQKELDLKEKKALDEKAAWQSKRKDYESEAKKWESQAQNSKSTYEKYKKMKD